MKRFENYKRQSLENISITWSSILEIWGEIGLVRESINVRNGFIAKYFQVIYTYFFEIFILLVK